jgi:DNA polymerase-3 subunit epsilon
MDNKPTFWHLYKAGGITPAIMGMFNPQNAQQMAFIRSALKEQRQKEWLDTQVNALEAVVFDLETSGFSAYNGDEIIAIGAVAVKGEQVIQEETFYSLVKPERPIPEPIERLTGIRNEEAVRSPELVQVLREFLAFVNHRVLIVHGSGHDKHFLNAALWKTSKAKLTYRIVDCLILAKKLDPSRQSGFDLDSMLQRFGIEITGRHHALNDAIMTAKLWSKLVLQANERGIRTLGDLYQLMSK